MTDNKTPTRFFQAKQIPAKLWNFCDQALQVNFILAHVPGKENPAADYLSRLDIDPLERYHLKLKNKIPVHEIKIDLAAKTPKQEGDEEDIKYDEIEYVHPHEEADKDLQQFLINTALRAIPLPEYDELTPAYEQRKIKAIEDATKAAEETMQGIYLTRFIPIHRRNLQALTLSNGIDLAEEQRKNLDIQRMIKILNEETLPPNNINFCSEFFQKLNKQKKRSEVNNYTLYRKYFDNTGKLCTSR